MKILLCNQSYKHAEGAFQAMLPGHELLSCPPDRVSEHLDGVDVLIPSVARIDKQIIDSGSFAFIQQMGVGTDNIDLDAASKAGVLVANVPGAGSGNTESVAELAVLMMLALGRKLDEARRNLASGVFFKPSGMAILNKTVCIVGLGDIVSALCRRLSGFDCRIVALRQNPDKQLPEGCKPDKVYAISQLPEALAQADFVVLALPENESTRGLFDKARFQEMKKGSFLINVARGGIVDLDALHDALQEGHLAGAGLDVFVEEPCDPAHPIFQQNLIATPHLGGNTDESFKGVIKAMVENLLLFAAGKMPRNLLNQPESCRKKLQARPH